MAFEQVISDTGEGARQKGPQSVSEAEEILKSSMLEHDQDLQAEAESALKDIPEWADERVKEGLVGQRAESPSKTRRMALAVRCTQEQVLYTALRYRPDLEEAHLKLIERYRRHTNRLNTT